ncbi:IS701 family transposase [Nocardia sp. NPDC049220]|uniref:IS701 family transposase n=1 Tax=Nocardia sp. NPDC049220 TaxID=3155273 RepID=UPI0033FA346F
MDEDLAVWVAGLDDLFGRVNGRFYRAEPRLRARAYVRGLLAPLAGKNGWTLAEAAGDSTPDGMQRLLNKAAWDADGVRDDLRAYAVEHLGDRDAVLVVGSTGFPKKGVKSAGVQRRYSSSAGRVENCQLGVFCAYTSSNGRTLIDRELYLPKSWTEDRQRCRGAAVPDEVVFATEATLAKQMLARALDAGVPARWVTAGEAYGGEYKFRSWLEQRHIGYVVAVPHSQIMPLTAGRIRADHLVAQAPSRSWRRLDCSSGTGRPRMFDWAMASLPTSPGTTAVQWSRWLLARRALGPSNTGELEVVYYLCCGPTGTQDEEMIRVAGAHWAIEDCLETAKTEVGLDHYQVRRYDAWYRHITLAMLANTYLAVTSAIAPKVMAVRPSRAHLAESGVYWHM